MRLTAEIAMLEQAAEALSPLLGEIVFVGAHFRSLLNQFGFIEALEGHLGSVEDAQTRTPIVVRRMQDIISCRG